MQIYTPHKALNPYIECYWSWQMEPEVPELDAILPDAAPEFIVHFGKAPQALNEADVWRQQPQSFLYCAANRAVRLLVENPIDLFAIRFRPWGVRRFSDRSMSDILDREVLPDEVFGTLGIELRDEIAGATDHESRVGAANTVLQRALRERSAQNDRLEKLLVLVNGGQTKARDLAISLGISDRSFRRLWHDVVGIEPRKFASLMRFHRAVSMIDEGHGLAAVAQECGYSDQPHLARNIKTISGLPASLLRKRLGTDVYQNLYTDRPSAPWQSSR